MTSADEARGEKEDKSKTQKKGFNASVLPDGDSAKKIIKQAGPREDKQMSQEVIRVYGNEAAVKTKTSV